MMNKKKILAIVMSVILGVVLLVGCAPKEEPVTSPEVQQPESTETAAPSVEPEENKGIVMESSSEITIDIPENQQEAPAEE